MARGDPGINRLDSACKEHDIAYSQNRENIGRRNAADKILAEKSWNRVLATDSGLSEKAAALAITTIMKAKSKLGMGFKQKKRQKKKNISKRKRVMLRNIVDAAKKSMIPSNDAHATIKDALKSARKAVKRAGGRSHVIPPRILPLPTKVGGFLPLIPLFAGLSALGALTGGAAGIAKAVNDASAAKEQLTEAHRHNRAMEEKNIGKGLHLKPYRQGLVLYIQPFHEGKGIKSKRTSKKEKNNLH